MLSINKTIFVQIWGLEKGDSGRSCEEHDICGSHVTVGMLLRLQKSVMVIEGIAQLVVGAYIFKQGHQTCLVGFLPKSKLKWANEYNHRFIQVDEFLSQSANKYEREKSHGKGGIINCTLLDSVPEFE
jgi:hypothetical protein